MVLRQFPNHYPTKMTVPRVTDFALASPCVVVRNEFVIARAAVIDTEICRLRERVPGVEVRLVVGRNDSVIALLSCARCGGPTLAWRGGPTGSRARAAAPNPTVKRDPNPQL